MAIDINTGIYAGADYIPSPNFNQRPDPKDISLLVVHCINLPPGQYNTQCVIDLFTNQLDCSQHPSFSSLENIELSSHAVITRAGRLIQFVPFHLRAWHAGQSCYHGREGCNDFSIGVELEGMDDAPYEDVQYQVLADLTQHLMQTYPITPDNIVGHSEIAPHRRTDPGPAFDWGRYHQLIDEYKCKV